ncbi:MAG: hypothetical protein IT369_10415 [Candidatus Latescibacteria bacterium]|nr:hypothetical protein [Candidatus Latescibacterota bacterium]
MENRAGMAIPGGWVVRLTSLFASGPYPGAQSLRSRPLGPQVPAQEAQSTTMQIIARVSAAHQEKLGLNPPFFANEFRGRC